MPLLKSSYNPPLFFKSGHASTVYSGLFRKVNGIKQERERITLSDGDFLDLDWSYTAGGSESLVILLHGLEGNAQRPYMLGSAKLFNSQAYDVVCVNFRNCSETPNTKYRSYHSGATEDLHEVIEHVINSRRYSNIYIVGVSLGGNMTLKYLGEQSTPNEIKGAVAISVPCSLYHSMLELHKFENILYAKRFKNHLLQKLRQKQEQFPDLISDKEIASIKTLKDFDDVYTSRAHGFKDALDYYEKSSSLTFIPEIKTPTLILNATDDSFLSPEC
ncbi:MAG: alpha/beta fold hydrolase, partial [Flavobacteriaceae bacterium]|nr:alpha/beta fold hydrolase [Flavobacteriaceae bacterium]